MLPSPGELLRAMSVYSCVPTCVCIVYEDHKPVQLQPNHKGSRRPTLTGNRFPPPRSLGRSGMAVSQGWQSVCDRGSRWRLHSSPWVEAGVTCSICVRGSRRRRRCWSRSRETDPTAAEPNTKKKTSTHADSKPHAYMYVPPPPLVQAPLL